MTNKQLEAMRERLALVRGERSQRSFAKEIGARQQDVNRYERGICWPHASFLYLLASREGVDLNWLLTGRRCKQAA